MYGTSNNIWNISYNQYLLSDADDDWDPSTEDLLIGLPVLQHYDIDTKTLLEDHLVLLDSVNCSTIKAASCGSQEGQVSKFMTAGLNRINNNNVKTVMESSNNCSRVEYFKVKKKADFFLDPSLTDPVGKDQHQEFESTIKKGFKRILKMGYQRTKKTHRGRSSIKQHTSSAHRCLQDPPVIVFPSR